MEEKGLALEFTKVVGVADELVLVSPCGRWQCMVEILGKGRMTQGEGSTIFSE
jgi:hypothetical protein